MRPTTLFYLYRVRLRARFVQELLAVAGIAVGVALLFASQVANTSLAGAVSQTTNGLIGRARLQLVARTPLGLNENLLTKVRSLDGVRVATPVLQRSAYLIGKNGRVSADLVGLGVTFAGLEGPLLAKIDTTRLTRQEGIAIPSEVARSIGVSALDPLTLQVGDRSTRTLVGIVLHPDEIGQLRGSRLAIAPLPLAQRLAGMPGRINRILVVPEAGRDAVVSKGLQRLAQGKVNVLPANSEATIFSQAEQPTAQSTEIFSAISALVGFLFAFNAILLTVPQRRSLIADLRLDGYVPSEIAKVMLFDALVLGICGAALGLGIGDMLSHNLFRAEPGYLALAFPVGSQHIVNWQCLVVACAGGLLAAIVGVMGPLRREIGGQPLTDRARDRSFDFRTASTLGGVGLAAVALTSLIVIHGMTSVGVAILAFGSLTIGLLLILPVAFNGVVMLIDRVHRPIIGLAPRIALIELVSKSTRSRSLAIGATGAVAVFGSVAIEGARANLKAGLARAAADISLGTDLWVTPAGEATTLPTLPFGDSYRRSLQGLGDVARVDAYRGAFLDIGSRRVLVVAPPVTNPRMLPASQFIGRGYGLAQAELRKGGWLAISQTLADEKKLKAGSSFTLASPKPTGFRVAGITTNLGWSPGAIVMNPADFARAWSSSDVSAYQITLRRGVSLLDGIREVRSAVHGSGLVVQSASEHEQNDLAAQRQGLERLRQISVLVLVLAAVAMAIAIAAMIWQRRPRLAGMKVDGFAQQELWRALLWETTLLLAIGCAIGAAFGLYGQQVLSRALAGVSGFPTVFSVSVSTAALSVSVVVAIAFLIVALPGYMAAQVKPALQD